MTTITDYIAEKAGLSFEEFPLNEVDIACLNELAYLPLGEWLDQPPLSFEPMPLVTFAQRKGRLKLAYDFLVTKERLQLFEQVVLSRRFSGLCLSYYTNDISDEFERQFAAMVLEIPEVSYCQMVFRGTDDTLIGWKEDFRMTYMSEIPAQRLAAVYLSRFLNQDQGSLVISGHSKGGNLALYAASKQRPFNQQKIAKLYLFDAPGMHQTLLNSPGYLAIQDKLVTIRPKESIVGVMLETRSEVTIVDSLKAGIEQHLMLNWLIADDQFVRIDCATPLSLALEATFKQWTQELTYQELKQFVDTFFSFFLDSGVVSLNDFTLKEALTSQKFRKVWQQIMGLDNRKRQLMRRSLRLLIKTFNKVSLEKQKERFEKYSLDWSEWLGKGK